MTSPGRIWWGAVAALMLLLVGASEGASRRMVALVGLRPTEDPELQTTRLRGLVEGQRLRESLQKALEQLVGPVALSHDQLKDDLGGSYLANLFQCEDEVRCVARVAAKLRKRRLESVLVGDYHLDGQRLRARLRLVDLERRLLIDEVTFSLGTQEADTAEAWLPHLAELLSETGTVRVVTNVSGYRCSLSAQPCQLDPDGRIGNVPPGEHLLQLEADGHRPAERKVTVTRGAEAEVSVLLEELGRGAGPVPVPEAPAPAAQSSTAIRPIGGLRLTVHLDDQRGSESHHFIALPRSARPSGWRLAITPFPSTFGVELQLPEPAPGWQLQGELSGGFLLHPVPELVTAFTELRREGSGLRASLGMPRSFVERLQPGTLQPPLLFGHLATRPLGAQLAHPLGPLWLEGFGGKVSSPLQPFGSGANPPASLLAARLGFGSGEGGAVDGPGGGPRSYLLGAMAAYGTQRVEDDRGAESVGLWLVAAELFAPVSGWLSLSGKAHLGQNLEALGGGAGQLPARDGEDRLQPLKSFGGWLQLAARPHPSWEVRLIGGTDRVFSGLGEQAPAEAIGANRLLACNATWYFARRLSFGLQAHHLSTRYHDPGIGTRALIGAAFMSELRL